MLKPSIDDYIKSDARVHLVGIGGVSMCSLAETLLHMNKTVTGSDVKAGDSTEMLKEKGVRIFIGHDAANIENAQYIVRTAAVHDDNPEIAAAMARGIPVFERAEAFGAIMKDYKNAVCVSGTHGKTTTSSMITYIAMAAGTDPSVMIGGHLNLLDGGYRVGGKDIFVLEACEYHNSFLRFFPTVAVILNVDADHMDFFGSLDDVSRSFRKFAQLVDEKSGTVVANYDDYNTRKCIEGLNRRIITFGFSEQADVRAVNLSYKNCLPTFDIAYKNVVITAVGLLIPGRHNVMNALAACAAAFAAGLPADAVFRGLTSFTGVERRFEYKGQYNGAVIYDDYAHHPSEIKALLDAAFEMAYDRVIVVFQPHTYTRTKAFFEDFIKELSRPDVLIMADIYAAREKNVVGISSADLVEKIKGAVYIPQYESIVDYLKAIAKPGDLVITVGAGEMNLISHSLAVQGSGIPKIQK